MTAHSHSAPALWAKTVPLAKDRVNNRSFWEALENTVGITVEENTLIIGLPAHVFNLAGHLSSPEHSHAIQQAASQAAGTPLKVRLIEGENLSDWRETKAREQRASASRETAYARRQREENVAQDWDSLYEQAARAYSNTPLRALPQGKARYLSEMLAQMSDMMNCLNADDSDEIAARMIARVIDRVATNAEVPATLVALELQRLRASRS